MRRSSRRRVTPRASSSAISGIAYLREVSRAARICDTVMPSGCWRSSAAVARAAAVDRFSREPDPVTFHDEAAAHELPKLSPVDRSWRRRRERSAAEIVEERVICKAVGLGDRSSSAPFNSDRSRGERAPRAGSRRVSRCRDRAGPPTRSLCATVSRISSMRSGAATHRPKFGSRCSPVSASRSVGSIGPRSAIRRSTERSGWALLTVRTGASSTISPPPTVSARPDSRSTNRSPGSSGTAAGILSRTHPDVPAAIASAPITRSCAGCSPEPIDSVYAPRRETSCASEPSAGARRRTPSRVANAMAGRSRHLVRPRRDRCRRG